MEGTRLFFFRRAFVTSQGKTADVFGSEAGLLVLRLVGSKAQPTVVTRPRGAVCMAHPSRRIAASPQVLRVKGFALYTAEPESAMAVGGLA